VNKQAYKPKLLEPEILTAAFSIMVILPIRKDVKHDRELVYNKVQNARVNLKLNSKPYPTWNYNKQDMKMRVQKLKQLIDYATKEDYVLTVQTIFRLMFTLFNTFINTKQYDSKDRHLLKLFIEEVTPTFCEMMKVKQEVGIRYMLQMFEREFGDRVPKDTYDIKKMARLFGDELLETLNITLSINRCDVLNLERLS
jgi:hypothetical protein